MVKTMIIIIIVRRLHHSEHGYTLFNLQLPVRILSDGWYICLFVTFLNSNGNLWIYAAQYDVIKNHLLKVFRRQPAPAPTVTVDVVQALQMITLLSLVVSGVFLALAQLRVAL